MPVVDKLAAEYADRVGFVAVAWQSTLDKTAARAAELMPSGAIRWGLDEESAVFSTYGIPYQPWTVLITGSDVEVERWPGARSEAEIRQALDDLIALGA
ncbi:MAG TPA: hypothetical protein VJ482_01585 [Acidimicrobiia bacterium]|nr:hypothetical protein [Acidimicrobiia bacterium]